MHTPFRFPYIAMTSYDLDRAQHLLIMAEFVDGHVDGDSVECLRFDLREARDAIYHLLGGKDKEVDTPVYGAVMFIETEDDSPIMQNHIKSMDAMKRYVALSKEIKDEFAKNLESADAEVMRLGKIQNGLVEDYPAVKWLRALNMQHMEKLMDKHRSGDCTHKESGPLGSVKNPVVKKGYVTYE